jgi:hypothetical protein
MIGLLVNFNHITKESIIMKLNNSAIVEVLNYIIENQTFDFSSGEMKTMFLSSIVDKLAANDEDKKQEIACAIIRCINEELIISNYKHNAAWNSAKVTDVTFRGFEWLEANS